ncbi:hypothetical protein F3087_28860 [Nocardia colli]|uniref:DNA lyase n=1 Tax=Nocardia colli TaxID=2545717 RepID=A0A5N0EBZ2_9NOCA|nr:hypothetical protein [Nocardia colli]KAA8885645.1 hypothetical protein F3087_28860 [Nocardia colli]
MVLRHFAALGLECREVERRWDHIGGLIVDAALQPRTKYQKIVLPRVRRVIADWPDADALEGFIRRLDAHDLADFLSWKRTSRKLTVIRDLTATLSALELHTVSELGAAYDGADRERDTRCALRQIRFVGPKTVDYIAILAGSSNHVAVDTHIIGFVRDAGVRAGDYQAVGGLIRQVADELGCSVGALDAAIWNHMSKRGIPGKLRR